jgi:hypothetical protein
MPWITPGAPTAPYDQVPFFNANMTCVSGNAVTDGKVMGLQPFIGPTTTAMYHTDPFPQSLTAVRIYAGRTGTAPSGNLLVRVYHTAFDGNAGAFQYIDFSSLAYDATATIPLSSLPLVPASNNHVLASTRLPYTEVLFDHPVFFDTNTGATMGGRWRPMIVFMLDNGFASVSNIVLTGGTTGIGGQATSNTSNNLNYSFSPCFANNYTDVVPSPPIGVPVCFAPELLFGPPVSGQTSGPGYAWGSPPGAVRGALGVGDGAPHPFPTPVAVATDLQKIASNGWVSLFLTADGQVLASGDNRQGGLGQGSTDSLNHQTPVLVPGLTGHTISDIVVGGSQQFASCLALDSGGSLYGWGANFNGELGTGDGTPHLSPFLIRTGVAQASLSWTQIAVLTFGGSVLTAGTNVTGELGQGLPNDSVTIHGFATLSLSTVAQVSCARWFTLFRMANGTVMGTGYAGDGNLGLAFGSAPVSTPVALGVSNVVEIQAGHASGTDAVGAETHLRVGTAGSFTHQLMGRYGSGSRGDGNTTAGGSASPITATFPPGITCTQLCPITGENNGLTTPAAAGIGTDDLLYTWGYGGNLQMGSGADPTVNAVPVSINGMTVLQRAVLGSACAFAIGVGPIFGGGPNFVSILG